MTSRGGAEAAGRPAPGGSAAGGAASPRLCLPDRGLEAFFRTPYSKVFVLLAELLQALDSRCVLI